jgi:hypothetical protein
MANELKQVYGAATTVISCAAAVANANGTDTSHATQLDNSNDYPYGLAVLHIPDTFAAAPANGSSIDLYMVRDDIDGTNDETPVPTSTDMIYLATYVGSWIMDNQDVETRKAMVIDLRGVRKARFFIWNQTGQQISYTSNPTTVKVTPFTVAPAA